VSGLPPQAQTIVGRIEALLAQAEPLLGPSASDEAGYALRETERRYLPDTVQAFLDIPPARRDAVAESMLVDQLTLLERATAQRLAALAESAENALSSNGAFLSERFGKLESLPEAPIVNASTAPPALLVKHVLDRIGADAGGDPVALLDVAGTRLAAAFPAIVQLRRSGFLGRGPVESLVLDVPRASDLLRYVLMRDRFGVTASVERFVRGVRLKALTVDVAEWTQGLLDDLGAYVERERDARDVLTRLFVKEYQR
jgi:hypothetical protein